jgi:hypothetical protein
MLSAYQQALNQRLRSLRLGVAPLPWKLVASIAIGGFESLAFSENGRFLLVVSSSGRDVFDAGNGALVASEHADSSPDWYDLAHLTVKGIGPLAGQSLRVAGIHGGGLPVLTLDGWAADLLSPDWPDSFVTLSLPGSSPFDEKQGKGVVKVAPTGGDDSVTCFGFSSTGRYLVAATSHTIDLFMR